MLMHKRFLQGHVMPVYYEILIDLFFKSLKLGPQKISLLSCFIGNMLRTCNLVAVTISILQLWYGLLARDLLAIVSIYFVKSKDFSDLAFINPLFCRKNCNWHYFRLHLARTFFWIEYGHRSNFFIVFTCF